MKSTIAKEKSKTISANKATAKSGFVAGKAFKELKITGKSSAKIAAKASGSKATCGAAAKAAANGRCSAIGNANRAMEKAWDMTSSRKKK